MNYIKIVKSNQIQRSETSEINGQKFLDSFIIHSIISSRYYYSVSAHTGTLTARELRASFKTCLAAWSSSTSATPRRTHTCCCTRTHKRSITWGRHTESHTHINTTDCTCTQNSSQYHRPETGQAWPRKLKYLKVQHQGCTIEYYLKKMYSLCKERYRWLS